MDPDHLDIYGSKEALIDNFIAFTNTLKDKTSLIVHEDISSYFQNPKTYGESDSNSLQLINVSIKNGAYQFDVLYKQHLLKDFVLNYPGRHNLTNAAAAILVALEMGISEKAIKHSISSFKGVKRRFEIHIQNKHHIYVDDYAHHPKEIEALVSSVREFYPKMEITGIFQPHLFSRTKDFMQEFCESLSKLDHLILMDIYPAREKPIKGINSTVLLENTNCKTKRILTKGENLSSMLKLEKDQVILTIGAGDIDLEVPKLKKYIANYSMND